VSPNGVADVKARDDSYSPARRAGLIGAATPPPAVGAGPVIFGDGGTRFTELDGLLLETIAGPLARTPR
jgi:hypothetical protein